MSDPTLQGNPSGFLFCFRSKDSEIFQRYKERIRWDFGAPNDVPDVDLFESLADNLKSFRTKCGLPKSSRWFSWNEQCHLQIADWWAARMILEYYYEGEAVLTPEEALQKNPKFANSFKDSGGLKLGYQCLSQQAFENAHAIFQVQLPLWNFYSDQLHFVKSPHHGLEECLRLCENWYCDRHLAELALCVGTGSLRQFNFLMCIVENECGFAKNVWDYALQCLANRCSTFSKHCSPPHSWALVLSNNADKQWQGMTAMRSDWNFLVALETSNAPYASDLASDLRICFGAPERLLAQCFEAVSWRARASPRGIELLLQLLGGFADSKLIEDIHQRLRNATGSKANDRLHAAFWVLGSERNPTPLCNQQRCLCVIVVEHETRF